MLIEGGVTISGSLVRDFPTGYTPSPGDAFTILDVGGAPCGQFVGLGEGALFAAASGERFQNSYATGNVVLTAVPESGSLVLILIGMAPLAGSRPQRTRRI